MRKFFIGDDFDHKADLFQLATIGVSIDVMIIAHRIAYGRIEYEGYILKQRPRGYWAIYYKEYEDVRFHALFPHYDLAFIYLCDKILNDGQKPGLLAAVPEWEAETGIKLSWTLS